MSTRNIRLNARFYTKEGIAKAVQSFAIEGISANEDGRYFYLSLPPQITPEEEGEFLNCCLAFSRKK